MPDLYDNRNFYNMCKLRKNCVTIPNAVGGLKLCANNAAATMQVHCMIRTNYLLNEMKWYLRMIAERLSVTINYV